MDPLTTRSAVELAEAMAAGETTSVAITQAFLDRIAEVDETPDGRGVHAFLHVDPEGALAAARASDERRAAGRLASPLDGVPVAVKDVFATEGLPTTCGSRILEGWVPPYDATVVRRLRQAGAPDPGQDQHGRVRDGLLHRALGLRPHAQPVGPRPHPRRLRWRLGGSGGGLRGPAGRRHRHRRLDPAAGCGDRHRGRQARPTAGSRATASSRWPTPWTSRDR